MMTHVSVRSSEVQVRTKPALRLCPRPLQNRVLTFLQSNNVPVILENGLRSNALGVLSSRTFYAWRRLAHLRSSLLYMEEGQPVVMIPPHSKEGDKAWTLRIPVNHRALAQVGPVVCECFWDSVDHDLVVSDVVYYNKTVVWETEDFTQRYERLVEIVEGGVLQATHEYSDCVVSVPAYETLKSAAGWTMDDKAFCVVFQPEGRGARRFRWNIGASASASAPKHQPVQDQKPNYKSVVGKKQPVNVYDSISRVPQIQSDSEGEGEAPVPRQNKNLPAPPPMAQKKPDVVKPAAKPEAAKPGAVKPNAAKPDETKDGITECTLRLDTKNPLPDSYILQGPAGQGPAADYGVAAVRSLFISLELREKLKTKESVRVQVAWYEPFKKWEVLSIKN
jgi:hypothetical protein